MTDGKTSYPIGRKMSLPGHFDEMVTLEEVRQLGNSLECRVRLSNGTLDETIITAEEAATVFPKAEEDASTIIPQDAERLRLLVESARIRLAYVHDRQFAVSLSGIRTLPHQIEAVYQKMLPQPRLRFLLADDPGAGKTIMAGLLIKELKLREAVERILILSPAPLTIQWQDELQQWFGEIFEIIDSARDQQQLINPWDKETQVIASIDYAKQDKVRERIWQQKWDLVIIDEAHKCSARTTSGGAGREPKYDPTKRYELAFKLSLDAENVLLLTATPHHGDEDKFAHFVRLLDPDLFPEPHLLSKQAHDIRKQIFHMGRDCPWSLRRLKEDLKDIDGQRLFPDRHVKTVSFQLNSEEYLLYKEVTAYINEYIPKQTGKRASSAALARTVLQRRLASSTSAIFESMKRRFKKQSELLEELERLSPKERQRKLALLQGIMPDAEVEEDDLNDAERDMLVDEYTSAIELDQLRAEVAVLKELVAKSQRVKENANDSKLSALKKCLSEAEFEELKDGRGKLLIFTEHKDTLNYLKEHLQKWGYTTCQIHGGMNPRDRKTAQELFRTQAQVCVATEAAGEGINLQFCHLMINYDIPWNPTRLEQRLGRIHRIGQERDVYAFNFVATDSEDGQPIIEGRILHRLLSKLDLMREALEGRVFDVIGEVLSINEVNLPEMLRDVAYDPRRLEEYIDQIDRINPEKLKEYEEATGIALARAHVDFTGFQKQNLEIEEKRLMPFFVSSFFLAAAEEIGLKVVVRADGLFRIEWVPADLRSDRLKSVKRAGKAESSYKKLTFQKQELEKDVHLDAVLLGPGHALYSAVDEKLNQKLTPCIGGVGFYVDPHTVAPYTLHFFEISIKGKSTKGEDEVLYAELVAVKEEAGQFEIMPCDIFVSLPEHPDPPKELAPVKPQGAIDFLKTTYQLERRADCQKEREDYAAICRDYLEKSFKARIDRTQEKVMELNIREKENPDVKRARENMEKKYEELKRGKEDRMSGLSKLSIARPGPIKHVASAIVVSPDSKISEQLAAFADEPDPIIQRQSELAAEDKTIESLIADGFPEDCIERVGHLKIGFDIRAHKVVDESSGAIDVRRVEVKGRIEGQPIRLTTNEWFKAQHLGNSYWLYVVWNPLTDNPKLVRIQNPAVKLDHAKKEVIAACHFEFPAKEIDTIGNR